ncbi:MAG: tetratricopeptide repeat protein [Acidobacteria bacterium]|nr:tetratricopeptide repeat protein [Acidobacteriota bacterium]MBI3423800.1 tetratricopeptide repeat protein [Acidobacteriota bacterium]
MKKGLTISFTLLAFGALALVLLRWLLPLMGLAGAGNEMIQPLEGLLPWLVWVLIAALALLLINLRWDRIFRGKKARRLVDEAEEWSDDFRIGNDAPLTRAQPPAPPQHPVPAIPRSKVRLFPEQLEPVERQEAVPVAAATPPPATEKARELPGPAPALPPPAAPLPKTRDRVTVAFAEEPESQVVALPNSGALRPLDPRQEADTITPSDIAKAATMAQTESLSTTYHQLPPRPEAFTGRAAALVALDSALIRHAQLLLHGPGGIGKTALALALAQQLTPHYPDAQFYLDLRGTSAHPLTTTEAQTQLLRAQPHHLPADLPAAYQAAFAGKRALLVLDNVADLQQLQPLLPPEDCLVIVTARQPLTLPDAFALKLEPLSANEATELLSRLVPRCAEAAAALAEPCGGLPLALRLVASALAQHPELTAANFAAKFAQLVTRLPDATPLETALTLSYEMLSHGLQKLWRMLAVFPDTFDVTGAAALWTLHPERALKALHRLMEFELVEGQLATGRYRLHDLKHAFAAKLLSEPDRQAAQQSHAEYYQSVLHEADALYEQGGDALQRGLGLVTRDWHNIQAGQAWAAAHAAANQAAAELCASYPDAGRYVLELRQPPRERLRWCETALAAAARLGRHKAEGRHLLAMGQACLRLGEYENARPHFDRALTIAQEFTDHSGTARALNGLGALSYEAGEFARAFDQHTQALEAARLANDPRAAAQALGGQGLAHAAMGMPDEAQATFELALAITREIGDLAGQGQAHFHFALAHEKAGERAQAVAQAQTALALLQQVESNLVDAVREQLARWR